MQVILARGDALLREVLSESRLVAVAKVVIASKQHLALLMPCGPALILNLLRWGGEIRTFEALELPPLGVEAAGIKEAEMNMARQLVNEMKSDWSADSFRDSFRDEVMKLVESKAAAGHFEEVEKTDASPPTAQNNVVDLTELLRRSMTGAKSTPTEKTPPAAEKKYRLKRSQPPRKRRRDCTR